MRCKVRSVLLPTVLLLVDAVSERKTGWTVPIVTVP